MRSGRDGPKFLKRPDQDGTLIVQTFDKLAVLGPHR